MNSNRGARRRTRIALVHDWLDTWAGGEHVLAEIAALYPSAPIFTLVDFMPAALRTRLGDRDVRTSFLQHMPFARRRFRSMLPLFPAAIERHNVSGFDVLISISHAVAKGVKRRPGQIHVCYCLSPIRYAWDLREQYLQQVGLGWGPAGWAARRVLDRIAEWDRLASSRVDRFVAISQHIRQRIQRCYDRDADVIYPPVRLPAFDPAPRARTRYVTVSRLVPYKRIDLIAAAFARLPDRELVIVGEGPERARVEAAAGPNVKLLGFADDATRDSVLAEARAFLFAADEDFGIAPLEAQGAGVPVIAYGRGGVTETIRGLGDPQPTGVFFHEQTPETIAEAVRRFEAHETAFDASACRRNAERFGPERFRLEFGGYVAAACDAFHGRRSA